MATYTFGEQVSNLQAARRLVQQFQKEVDDSYEDSYDEWRAANEDVIARAEQAKKNMQEIEYGLRNAIVMHYDKTGDKKPHPKLGVRVSEVPVYDEDVAYNFALHSVPKLLKLDGVAFKSYAKGVRMSVPLSFVEWEEKVMATIAKNLEE